MESYEIVAKEAQAQPVVTRPEAPKVYDLKVYRTMKDRKGEDVDVLVGIQPVQLTQLEAQLAQMTKSVVEIQSKIDAIKALEA